MTYSEFEKINLPVYLKAGMTRKEALREIERDWQLWKRGAGKNPELPIGAVETRFWNYKGRRYVKDSIWDTELEANKRVSKLRSDGFLAEVVFSSIGTIYNKKGYAYSAYKIWPRRPGSIMKRGRKNPETIVKPRAKKDIGDYFVEILHRKPIRNLTKEELEEIRRLPRYPEI